MRKLKIGDSIIFRHNGQIIGGNIIHESTDNYIIVSKQHEVKTSFIKPKNNLNWFIDKKKDCDHNKIM